VQVRVVLEGLPPCVEHGDKPDIGAEMARIGGDGAEGDSSGTEQDVVNHAFVLRGNRGDWLGDREDDVEVRHRKQFGLASFQQSRARQGLAFWTVTIPASNGHRPLPASGVSI